MSGFSLSRGLFLSLALCRRGLFSGQPCPDSKSKAGKLPFIEFDVANRQVRVECEALGTEAPLEFFCCKTGTNDYEAAIRSSVLPSHLHTALLLIGLKPGEPVTYSEAL